MIFGRGGAGGVVNRVSRQANWQPVREVALQGGSWDNRRATFDVGDAISDGVAVRITGVYEDSESYRDDFELERKGVNPTVAFALGESTVLRVSYEYYDYDRVADRGIPSLAAPSLVDGPFRTSESTFFGDPDQSPTARDGEPGLDHDRPRVQRRRAPAQPHRVRRLRQVLPERLRRRGGRSGHRARPARRLQQRAAAREFLQPDRPDVLGADRLCRARVPGGHGDRRTDHRQPAHDRALQRDRPRVPRARRTTRTSRCR